MRFLIVAVFAIPLLVDAPPLIGEPLGSSRDVPRALPGPGRYAWPLAPAPPALVRPFERPADLYGPGHRGVDLVGDPDQPVFAAGAGLVVHAGRVVDREVVSIEHPIGLRTTYEPVAPTVRVGAHVTAGEPIGRLQPGHPECEAPAPATCLHWGARRRLDYLDPLRLLHAGNVRLLPWSDAPGRSDSG